MAARELLARERLFQAYFDLGPERTVAKLHELVSQDPGAYDLETVPALRTLRGWAAAGRWYQRIHDPLGYERERAEKRRLDRIEEHRERLCEHGLALQEAGRQLLPGVPGNRVKLDDAVRAILAGVKLEAYGLMSSSDSNPPLALSSEHQGQLTDTEIKTLARLARKLIGEPPEKQSQSDGKKRKLYWWELDYDKLEYMSPRERAAYVEQHKQRVESEYRWLAKQQRAS